MHNEPNVVITYTCCCYVMKCYKCLVIISFNVDKPEVPSSQFVLINKIDNRY
ncbi:hypothetical protein [Candidatus Hodgkinia cicadicola]|uniref:hypothetical protein n=1 Tax=Candidatus Hodgkinia cicadicola TaxID=573658 RepID=UPI00241561D1